MPTAHFFGGIATPAARNDTLYPLSSALPTLPPKEEARMYVILSVSEISHDQSDKVYAHQFFGGILHSVQDDVKKSTSY